MSSDAPVVRVFYREFNVPLRFITGPLDTGRDLRNNSLFLDYELRGGLSVKEISDFRMSQLQNVESIDFERWWKLLERTYIYAEHTTHNLVNEDRLEFVTQGVVT